MRLILGLVEEQTPLGNAVRAMDPPPPLSVNTFTHVVLPSLSFRQAYARVMKDLKGAKVIAGAIMVRRQPSPTPHPTKPRPSLYPFLPETDIPGELVYRRRAAVTRRAMPGAGSALMSSWRSTLMARRWTATSSSARASVSTESSPTTGALTTFTLNFPLLGLCSPEPSPQGSCSSPWCRKPPPNKLTPGLLPHP